jgi:hypothetical protein
VLFGHTLNTTRLGLAVLTPLTEHGRYDLALDLGGRILRVQCKWGNRRGDVIQVRVGSSYHSPTRGYVTATYDETEIDAIAVYCASLDSCYLLPKDLFSGVGMVSLRVGQTQNGQRAALNWAPHYEFRGAVAQLEERVAGSDEVRGSSPLSSTDQRTHESTAEDVGAHEFRNRFGFYMERVAAGERFVIRRRGKPHASRGPPPTSSSPVS